MGLRDSGTTIWMPISPAITMGTLMRKTEPQSLPVSQWVQCGFCSSSPPRTGPSATAPPTAAAQRPIALPRSCAGKTIVMMASVTGSTAAPPIPITPRKTISMEAVGAKAQTADAMPKRASPIERIFLRPNRSPRTPQVNSSAANTSTYASTAQTSWLCDAPRSRWIVGRAMFRTVLSSTTTSRLTTSTDRIVHRRGWPSGVGAQSFEARARCAACALAVASAFNPSTSSLSVPSRCRVSFRSGTVPYRK